MMSVKKETKEKQRFINFSVCVNDLGSVDVLHVSYGYSSIC